MLITDVSVPLRGYTGTVLSSAETKVYHAHKCYNANSRCMNEIRLADCLQNIFCEIIIC